MTVQGSGIKLGQNGDLINAGVQAIADGDIDEPVFSGNGHGWLGPQFGEGIQPRTLAASHNQAKDMFHDHWMQLRVGNKSAQLVKAIE
jgi:hypothetical protein